MPVKAGLLLEAYAKAPREVDRRASRRAWCDRPRARALRVERARGSLWLTTAEERNNSTVTVSNTICQNKNEN